MEMTRLICATGCFSRVFTRGFSKLINGGKESFPAANTFTIRNTVKSRYSKPQINAFFPITDYFENPPRNVY